MDSIRGYAGLGCQVVSVESEQVRVSADELHSHQRRRSKRATIIGRGQGVLDTDTGVVTRMLEVANPPFAFQLILDGDPDYASGVDISSFTEMDLADRKDFEIEGLLIGCSLHGT